MFGIKNYTIIDIPLTNVAQSYFLGRCIGNDSILLAGDNLNEDERIKIIPSNMLPEIKETFDLIVNVDSMTEMPLNIAEDYWSFILSHSKYFLSINHEINPFTIRDLYKTNPKCTVNSSRYFYPLRRGYIEEIIKIL